MKTASGQSRLSVLDLYRAVAILAVMIAHYTVRWTPPRELKNYYPYEGRFSWPVLEVGGSGVSLFFVVSGFVILMTLERSGNIIEFALKRFARLFPPMLVCATITTIVLNTFGPKEWSVSPAEYISSIFFIPPALLGKVLGRPEWDWVDGAYWSLFVEVRFYAISSIFFLIFERNFLKYWALFQAVSTALNFLIQDDGVRLLADSVFIFNFLPYFSFGMFCYSAYRGRIGRYNYIAISVIMLMVAEATEFRRYTGDPDKQIEFMISCAVIFSASVGMILKVKFLGDISGKAITRIGESSYSLYLLHQLVGVVAINVLARFLSPVIALLIVFASMIIISLVLYKYVEVPGRNLFLKLTLPLAKRAQGVAGLRFSHADEARPGH